MRDREHYSESSVSIARRAGRIFAVGAIYRDVTDNRRAGPGAGRPESEHRFRSLADAAFEGIVIHDHGIIVDCNISDMRSFLG
jgi:PAS domain-containing protein